MLVELLLLLLLLYSACLYFCPVSPLKSPYLKQIRRLPRPVWENLQRDLKRGQKERKHSLVIGRI